jgi:hypothetical protein
MDFCGIAFYFTNFINARVFIAETDDYYYMRKGQEGLRDTGVMEDILL